MRWRDSSADQPDYAAGDETADPADGQNTNSIKHILGSGRRQYLSSSQQFLIRIRFATSAFEGFEICILAGGRSSIVEDFGATSAMMHVVVLDALIDERVVVVAHGSTNGINAQPIRMAKIKATVNPARFWRARS